jgi:hypothetical protein
LEVSYQEFGNKQAEQVRDPLFTLDEWFLLDRPQVGKPEVNAKKIARPP